MFKTKNLICYLLILYAVVSHSQNETKKWFFGNGAGLDFSTPTPTVVSGGAITTSLGCASIADAAGNLLFYTDGATVYNQTHSVMANGSGLFGGNVAQTALILKRPSSANQYYLFTQQTSGLYYSVIDMSLASGSGSVTTKNIALYTGVCAGKLTAARHCNGTDYWLLAVCSNSFYAFPVTTTTVGSPVLSSLNTPLYCSPNHALLASSALGYTVGGMKLSPNGKRLLATTSHTTIGTLTANYIMKTHLYDFDNATGNVMNGRMIDVAEGTCGWQLNQLFFPYFPYGCEFSPDGSKAYFSSMFGYLNQYNLCAPFCSSNIAIVALSEAAPPSFTTNASIKRTFQLGPDGRIYIAASGSQTSTNFVSTNSLAVIGNPNAQTGSAFYNPVGQSLGTYSCQWGLPNFPGFYFEQKPLPNFTATSNSSSGCSTYTFMPPQVCSSGGYTVLGYQWNFGDPSSGSLNTSFLAAPAHSFGSAGTYSVKLIRSFSCHTDTVIKVLNVYTPSVTVLNQPGTCAPGSATAIVSGPGPANYTWYPGQINTPVITVSVSGIYTLNVINEAGCALVNTFSLTNNQLASVINHTIPSCFGYANGAVTVTSTGGSGNLSYIWNPGNLSGAFQNSLAAGVYTLQVTDQIYSCSIQQTISLAQPGPLSLIMSPSVQLSAGSSNMIWGYATGGVSPYTYNWTSGPSTFSRIVQPSTPGNFSHTLNVTDAKGCTASNTVLSSFTVIPTLVAVSVSSICSGAQATLMAGGALSYTWQPGYITGNPVFVNPATTTIYTVTGDSLGFTGTASTTVFVANVPSYTTSSNNPLCINDNLQVTVNGNAQNYYWTGPNGFVSTQASFTIFNAQPSASGIYTLTLTGANGCSVSTGINFTVVARPFIQTAGTASVCSGQSVSLFVISSAFSYFWSGPSGYTNTMPTIIIPNATQANSGVYTLVATGAGGCTSSTVINLFVDTTPALSVSGQTLVCFGESVAITAVGGAHYAWSNGASGPATLVNPNTTTVYTVTAYNQTGSCFASTAFTVNVNECTAILEQNNTMLFHIYPNPTNGVIHAECGKEYKLLVYDQLGKLVHCEQLISGCNRIVLSGLASGVYRLSVNSGTTETTRYYKLILEN